MIEIDVSKALMEPGSTFGFEYAGTPEIQDIRFVKPLRLTARYGSVNGDIHVKGMIFGVIKAQCTRCLNDVEYEIERGFDELFRAKPDDQDEYSYKGEAVELDKLVYDAIVLELPFSLLCSESCKGLCPKCGANLNEGLCTCDDTEIAGEDNPFGKLKDLFKS